jgi:hypothetical protein
MDDDDLQQAEAKDAPEAPGTLDLLADRRKPVWHLFEQFDRIKDGGNERRKRELAATICREISAGTETVERRG